MDRSLSAFARQYQESLLLDVVPFWLNHSTDSLSGGYFTCLNRKGEVFDQDKFIWLQGRQVWTYAMLYNKVEKKEEWLQASLHGASFLQKYGRNPAGAWYFSLTRQGQPLTQPYSIFSDCFATMGFAQLYKATQNQEFKMIAVDTLYQILDRKEHPKGSFSKTISSTRPLKGFSLPMILSNLALEMEGVLDPTMVSKMIDEAIDEVMGVFYQADSGLILENVALDGKFVDCFEGRLVNPGHGLEAMWFIMDLAHRKNDVALMQKAVETSLNILEFGWDKKFGGIFYFLDYRGHDPSPLEWDQKLWWVHVEALVNTIKGYFYTGDTRLLQWFYTLHEYTWNHFPDAAYGEWFGYLNRQGEPLLTVKGGKWKGFFHIPRALYQVYTTLYALETESAGVHQKPSPPCL